MAVYTKNTSDAMIDPTTGASVKLMYYAPHPFCYFRLYRPQTTAGASLWSTTQPHPVMIRFHGGGGQHPHIELKAKKDANSTEVNATSIPDTFRANGWVYLNVEYPLGGFPANYDQQGYPVSVMPQIYQLAMRVVQFVRDHYNDAGIWGANHSIDPEKIVLDGDSFGAWVALMGQWTPRGWGLMSQTPALIPTQSEWTYSSDYKVRAVFNRGAPYNLRQLDPSVGYTGSAYVFDGTGSHAAANVFFAPAYRYKGTSVTDPIGFGTGNPAPTSIGLTTLSPDKKRRASPQWLIRYGGSTPYLAPGLPPYNMADENKEIAIFSNYGGTPSVPWLATDNIDATKTGLYGVDDDYFSDAIAADMNALGIQHKTLGGSSGLTGQILADTMLVWARDDLLIKAPGFP